MSSNKSCDIEDIEDSDEEVSVIQESTCEEVVEKKVKEAQKSGAVISILEDEDIERIKRKREEAIQKRKRAAFAQEMLSSRNSSQTLVNDGTKHPIGDQPSLSRPSQPVLSPTQKLRMEQRKIEALKRKNALSLMRGTSVTGSTAQSPLSQMSQQGSLSQETSRSSQSQTLWAVLRIGSSEVIRSSVTVIRGLTMVSDLRKSVKVQMSSYLSAYDASQLVVFDGEHAHHAGIEAKLGKDISELKCGQDMDNPIVVVAPGQHDSGTEKQTLPSSPLSSQISSLPEASSSPPPPPSLQPPPSPPSPPTNGKWTAEADLILWNRREEKANSLADAFSRSVGSIRSRLKHLQSPEHKAYQRLQETLSTMTQAYPESSKVKREPTTIQPSQPPSSASPRSKAKEEKMSIFSPPVIGNIEDVTSGSNHCSNHDHHGTKASLEPEAHLVEEQLHAADLVLVKTANIFLTGAAGTGKSTLLKHIIKSLKAKTAEEAVMVTGTTGIAASHIDGVTLHSFAGIGLGKEPIDALLAKVCKNYVACERWRQVQYLIIDEVSMLDSELFDKLNRIAKNVRRNDLPFGGIQLILCGDFYQLPPVQLGRFGCKYGFESLAWSECNIQTVELKQVHRQGGDLPFIRLLHEIRLGKCSHETQQMLASCHLSRKPLPDDGIKPTQLYCINKNVDEENTLELEKLPGKEMSFRAHDEWLRIDNDGKSTLASMEKKLPSVIKLKVGAQVMLTRNMLESGLVNGSRGIVVGFSSDYMMETSQVFPHVQFDGGLTMPIRPHNMFQGGVDGAMSRTQLPLKLAWALTVHKSQGMTLSRVKLRLENAFEWGQVYVALSRVESLKGLWIVGDIISQSVVKAHPAVLKKFGS